MKRALFVFALAGCASPIAASRPGRAVTPERAIAEAVPGEPPRIDAIASIRDGRADGEQRPRRVAVRRIDAATLPLARWDAPIEGSRVRFAAPSPSFQGFVVEGVSFASFTLDDGFGAFTGTNFVTGNFPTCGGKKRPRARATWEGFSQRGWTDAGVDVVMSRGAFDYVACSSVPETSLRARAVALVPGFVYGLRTFDMGARWLFVLTPRAVLASATENEASAGSFTMATLPLDPHRGAAASLRIPARAIQDWREMRRSRPVVAQADQAADAMLLDVEVEPGTGDDLIIAVSAALPPRAHPTDFAPLLDAVSGAGQSGPSRSR